MRCADPDETGCARDALALAVTDELIAPVCGDCGLLLHRRLREDVRLRWMDRDPSTGTRGDVLTSNT